MFDLRNTRNTWAAFVCVMALLAWVMYGSTPDLLQDTDDGHYFSEASLAYHDISHLFSPDRHPAAMGRPVIDLVFLVDYALWETRLDAYHYQVVVAHFFASLLLAFAFYQLGASLSLSFTGALFFLVNVAHFRAVHWIASIGYPLSLIFALGAVIAHVRASTKGRLVWVLASALSLGLAVLTHPAVVSVLLFCVYLSWRNTGTLRRTIAQTWPLTAIALCCVLLCYWLYPRAAQVEAVDTPLVVGRVFETFAWYLSRLMTAPHWLFVNLRDVPEGWELAVGALGYLGLFGIWRWASRPVSDFAVWVVVTILPFYSAGPGFRWTPAGPSRHLYFASAGTSLILAFCILWLGRYAARRGFLRVTRVGAVGVICAIVGLSLYNDHRAQAVSFYASGRTYVAMGEIDRGILQFERAIDCDPELVPPEAFVRLSHMHFARNLSPLKYAAIAHQQFPEETYFQFVEGLWDTQQREDSVRVARGVKKIKDAFDRANDQAVFRFNAATAFHNLGTYYYNQKRYEDALGLFQQALDFRPSYHSAAFHLGLVYWFLGLYNESLSAFQRAIEIDPDHVQSYLHMGKLFLHFQRFEAAQQVAELILSFAPEEADAYYILGAALTSQQQAAEAEDAFQKAFQFNPDHIQARLGLAALYSQKRPEKAMALYREVLDLAPENAIAQQALSTRIP